MIFRIISERKITSYIYNARYSWHTIRINQRIVLEFYIVTSFIFICNLAFTAKHSDSIETNHFGFLASALDRQIKWGWNDLLERREGLIRNRGCGIVLFGGWILAACPIRTDPDSRRIFGVSVDRAHWGSASCMRNSSRSLECAISFTDQELSIVSRSPGCSTSVT